MEYHVFPFTARITQKDTTAEVAKQLETLIQHYAAQGLEYVRLESVETVSNTRYKWLFWHRCNTK